MRIVNLKDFNIFQMSRVNLLCDQWTFEERVNGVFTVLMERSAV